MEPRFGRDFSRVRIHTDAEAAESAQLSRAQAYTVANHIVFGRGRFSPRSHQGRKLLAHELVHTVQQSHVAAAPVLPKSLQVSQPEDEAEREADAAAEQATSNGESGVGRSWRSSGFSARPGLWLQRQADEKKPGPAERELSRQIHAAAQQATQKVHEEGLDELPKHIPQAPELRPRPKPKQPPKAEPGLSLADFRSALRDDDKAQQTKQPDQTSQPSGRKQPERLTPEKGSREVQVSEGVALQSGPGQVGPMVQVALQDKNWVPGVAFTFLRHFRGQLGILQPNLTLQLTQLQPIKPGAGTAQNPLPPPDTLQLSGTVSPLVVKAGPVTAAVQVGLAAAVAGDPSHLTAGPGASGTHFQFGGVVNLQVDVALAKEFSLTGSVGGQGLGDVGPKGLQGQGNVTASFAATLHF